MAILRSIAPRRYSTTMNISPRFFALVVVVGTLLVTACSAPPAPPAPSSAKKAAPTLQAPATPVKASQPFTVAWTGPNGADDYIDLVSAGHQPVGDEKAYVKTATGNPVTLTAPAEPGTYDVRYVQDTGSRAIVARTTVTVVP